MSVLQQTFRAPLYFAVAAIAFALTSWLNQGDAPADVLPALTLPSVSSHRSTDPRAARTPMPSRPALPHDQSPNRWAVDPQLSAPQSPFALNDDPSTDSPPKPTSDRADNPPPR